MNRPNDTSVPKSAEVDSISAAPSGAPEQTIRRLRARDMLGPERIVHIEHEGEVYTLRLTRNNRLILTK